jgi:hypothetical protein
MIKPFLVWLRRPANRLCAGDSESPLVNDALIRPRTPDHIFGGVAKEEAAKARRIFRDRGL